jgi:hypothetical protein
MATAQVAGAAADELAAPLPLSAHMSAFPSAPPVAAVAADGASLSAAVPQPVPSPAAATAVTVPGSKRNATSMMTEKDEGDAQKEAGSEEFSTQRAILSPPTNALHFCSNSWRLRLCL